MCMRPVQRRHGGFTIIELLVAIVVGLLVLAGVLQVFSASFRANNDAIGNANLNEQLRAVTGAVAREVRRSGYWADAIDDLGTGTVTNPYTGLSVVDQNGDGVGDCVLYGYDADDEGDMDANEWRGFRFNAATNSIEVTSAGGTQALVNGGDCSDAWTWTDFVDPNLLEVTDVRLTLTPTRVLVETQENCPTSADEEFWVEVRTVLVEVDGRLADNDQVTRSTSTVVRVRNDRLFTQTIACP